jgi:protein-tyrosine phosphatase
VREDPLPFASDNAPEGAHNFRDLGGLRTKDGLSIRRGKVFRSGDLSNLSEHGRLRIKELGVETMFDLRDKAERARRPYEWCKQAGIAYWAYDYDMSGASIRELLKIANITGRAFKKK